MFKKQIFFILALAFFSLGVSAQEQTNDCVKPDFDDSAMQNFPKSIPLATEAHGLICSGDPAVGVSAEQLNEVFTELHAQLIRDAEVKIPTLVPHLYIYLEPLLVLVGNSVIGMVPNHIADFPTNSNDIGKLVLYKQGRGPAIPHEVPKEIAQACYSDLSCWSGFTGYMDILKKVYAPLGIKPLVLAEKVITLKDEQWTQYIEESRSQTLLDIAFTTFAYEFKYSKQPDVFSSPPRVQWFFMHPSVTIENVSNAIDGDESKEALALEVLGFNYWQDACFGYACGASLIVNYADRNGIDDRGWGLMFHVENSYSFGVTKHGGETGIFITVDLLKLFQDKKSAFKQYEEKFRKLGQ